MADREVIEAVLGSDIAIAGLVLVFAGFLLTKAESFRGSRAGMCTVGSLWPGLPQLWLR